MNQFLYKYTAILICWIGLGQMTMVGQYDCVHPDTIIAQSLYQQGKVAFSQGNLDSALVYMEAAKESYKTIECWEQAVHMLRNIVTICARSNRAEQVQENLMEGLAIANEYLSDSSLHKAKIFASRGQIDMSLGNLDSAKWYLEKSVEITEKVESWSDFVKMNRELARLSYYQQDFVSMEQYLDKAYNCAREKLSGNSKQIQAVLQLYGALYYRNGNYEKALEKNIGGLDAILKNMSSRSDSILVASFYNNIGLLYIEIGDIYNAEDYCKNALNFSKRLKDNYKASTIYLNLGEFFKLKGQEEKAYNYYLKGLDLLKYAKDKSISAINRSYINFNNGIGEVGPSINRHKMAFEALMRNVEIHKKEVFKREETYRILGLYYSKMKANKEALSYFNKALKENQKLYGEQHPLVARCYSHIGTTYGNMGESEKSLEVFEKGKAALMIDYGSEYLGERPEVVMVSDKEIMLDLLESKAKQLYNDKALLRAYSAIQNALILIDEMRKGFKAEGSKLFLVQRMIPAYELAIDLALQLNKTSGDKTYLEEAFRLIEKSKAMLLLEALKTEEARTFGDVPEDLLLEERRLAREIVKSEKKLFEAQIAKQKDKMESVQQDLLELRRESSKLQATLETNYKEYYELKYKEKIAKLEEVQESLDGQTGLLEFFVGNKQILIFSVYSDSVWVHSVPVDPSFEESITVLRNSLVNLKFIMKDTKAAYLIFATNAHRIYTKYIEPCLKKDISRLIIVPDGLFNYIPMDVLLTEKPDHTMVDFAALPYVIKKYRVSYQYSASLMLLPRPEIKTNGKILGMASVYNDDMANDIANDRHQKSIRIGIKDLPGARKEVEMLKDKYSGDFFLGEKANEKRFKKMIQKKNYSVVHLAMHGWVDDFRPEYSNLVFTYTPDSTEDDLLHAYELSLLELETDLVVLSACETGFGKYERGEGVVSLGRGFMYSGASSLIMTLWPINDQATALLIDNLYGELANEKSIDEALRNAKLAYLDKTTDISAHPFFWGSFIMVGDPSPIKIKPMIDWISWILYSVLGLGVMGLLGMLFFKAKA
ncbi:MAG: CHAT domain-containing protein [Aureispira sp.]|nr:CHAT domain-containing protein [Aureispira sp.]